MRDDQVAETILFNGRIATQDGRRSFATAVAIKEGRFTAVGSDGEVLGLKGADTRVVDLKGRTAVPGLNDSHNHVIRGGLSYNAEVRWEGLNSLREGLRRVKEQASQTPDPYWVKVVGGWSEFQFEEQRGPTLGELNDISRDVPIFVVHLYHDALMNKAALRAAGISKETVAPPGAEVERDAEGNPTGAIVAKPNASILYSTLSKSPKLPREDQSNSTRQFLRKLNSLGVTSIIDAGGGGQYYPEDYSVISELAKKDLLSVRVAYSLFTQRSKQELADYAKWSDVLKPETGTDFYRLNGAGEMLVYSAADYENFLEVRPELGPGMEDDLRSVIELLVQRRWPFRLHATYDESIERFLDVFESVNEKQPFAGLRWNLDHAETISSRSIRRLKKLGGGIAIQDRMAFQGEHFIEQYGEEMARRSPPIAEIIEAGVPIGGGTDATRVASYDPWVALYWLVSGKTVGGTELYRGANRLDRMEALRLWTVGSAWFSGEQGRKGSVEVGKLADIAVLSDDYFSVPTESIKSITSALTVVGGRVVHGVGEFSGLAPEALQVAPPWSPVAAYPDDAE